MDIQSRNCDGEKSLAPTRRFAEIVDNNYHTIQPLILGCHNQAKKNLNVISEISQLIE
jgi:hypothetical protein